MNKNNRSDDPSVKRKNDAPLLKKIPLWAWTAIAVLFAAEELIRKFVFGGGCLLKDTTGIPCPACGMSRAFFCLVTGNLREAFYFNPAFPAAGAALIFFFMIFIFPKRQRIWFAGMSVSLAAIIVVWVIRLATGNAV